MCGEGRGKWYHLSQLRHTEGQGEREVGERDGTCRSWRLQSGSSRFSHMISSGSGAASTLNGTPLKSKCGGQNQRTGRNLVDTVSIVAGQVVCLAERKGSDGGARGHTASLVKNDAPAQEAAQPPHVAAVVAVVRQAAGTALLVLRTGEGATKVRRNCPSPSHPSRPT